MSISVNNLANEIARVMKEYTEEVEKGIEVEIADTAKEMVSELKSNSPKRKGKYAKGWSIKKEKSSVIVHNRTSGQITHLLEKGHAKRGGGRVAGIPHIAQAEETFVTKLEKNIERIIKNGGR